MNIHSGFEVSWDDREIDLNGCSLSSVSLMFRFESAFDTCPYKRGTSEHKSCESFVPDFITSVLGLQAVEVVRWAVSGVKVTAFPSLTF